MTATKIHLCAIVSAGLIWGAIAGILMERYGSPDYSRDLRECREEVRWLVRLVTP